MENYLPLLQSTSLFAGISAGELRPLLSELGACMRSYGRGEALVQAGVPSEVHLFAHGGHGFGVRIPPDLTTTQWPALALRWMHAQEQRP